MLSKSAICGRKKSKFINKQEASGVLSSLGLKTLLSKIPLFDDNLFSMQFHWIQFYQIILCKMNKIVNKFLLAGDKFTLEMHFKKFFKKLNLLIVL